MIAGEGIKKTHAWFTDLSETEIKNKIEEFWHTRIDGNQETWEILYKICKEPDTKKCKSMLKASNLNLSDGTLSQVYDLRGHRYDLPLFVINPPTKYGFEKEVVLEKVSEDEEFKISFRIAGKSDFSLPVRSSVKVSDLKVKLQESMNTNKNLRFFFHGKELKDGSILAHYKLAEGFVIIVI